MDTNGINQLLAEMQRAQALAQGLLQRLGQREGVFHGVQLDQARRVLNGVGVHGLHIRADAGQRAGAQGIGSGHDGARKAGDSGEGPYGRPRARFTRPIHAAARAGDGA